MRAADNTTATPYSRNGRAAFAEDQPGDLRRRVTQLVAGIAEDYGSLAGDQARLFRAEWKIETLKVRKAWWLYAFGVGLCLAGISIVLVSLVPMLGHAFPALPLWARMLMVGGLFLAVGGTLLQLGHKSLAAATPFPDQSWKNLKENLACVLNPRNK